MREENPKPPSDEGGGPKGRRERKAARFLPALRENETGLSPPVSFADSPLVRGGQGWVSKTCLVRGGQRGGCLKSASSEGAEGGVR